ncbi:hypothetical protein YC2023_011081 [Brassica napus]
MIWWLKQLKLDSWKPFQYWSMILQYKQTLIEREISRERGNNFYLPAGPDTCLSILASCDRYPHRDCVYVLLEDKQKGKSGRVDRPWILPNFGHGL